MEWGKELFDRYDELMKHITNSIEFMDHTIKMNAERIRIENEYAKQMKKMVSKFQLKKKDDYGGNPFTYETAYGNSLQEINSIALQHEVIAENLKQSVVDPSTKAMQDLKKARTHFQTEYSKMEKAVQRSTALLDGAFKRYRTAHQDMIKADEMYRAAEDNRNLARVEVDRQKQYAENKRAECERIKSEYAVQLENTNKVRNDFYHSALPALLNNIRDSDKYRTLEFQKCLKAVAESESSVMHTISTCHQGVITCSEGINWDKDSASIVDTLRSGFSLPCEIPFTDLDTISGADSVDSINVPQVTGTGTIRSKNKERSGFGWFKSKQKENDLGPEQQRKKLTQTIKEIQGSIAQEEKKKSSMEKLRNTYDANSQNYKMVEQEIRDAEAKLQTLHEDLSRQEAALNELTGGGGGGGGNGNGSSNSLNNSANGQLGGSVPPTARASTVSTVSAATAPASAEPARASRKSRSTRSDDDFDDYDEFDEPAPAAPAATAGPTYVGGCLALYDFSNEDASGLNMKAGDQFYVVQVDAGDGWTLVTTLDASVQGYVPSGYLDIQLY